MMKIARKTRSRTDYFHKAEPRSTVEDAAGISYVLYIRIAKLRVSYRVEGRPEQPHIAVFGESYLTGC
jgi:hypothetical protein